MRDFQLAGRSPVYATNGMAATSMPAATLTAIDVLRAGGNALDAAVAAVALLGVVEPQSTGIGGDCFCLYKPAGRPVVAINGSGRAPSAISVEALTRLGVTSLEPESAHCVTVPGALAAWELLLAHHGRKGLDELLRPAIQAAEEGFVVAPRVAFDWAEAAPKLRRTGAVSFLRGGAALQPGDLFRQPALAQTFRHVARDGATAFYDGEIAARTVAMLRARGGLHTEADFAAMPAAVDFVTPITRRWRGYDVWECPPNGSGLLVLMLLGILEGMPVLDDPLSPQRLHRHAEAGRLVYRDRDALLCDPTQNFVPMDRLLSDRYLDAMRALIRDDAAMAALPAGGETMLPAHQDTVYVSVVDRDGNACSFINSIFQNFGSGLLVEQDGIMLHNRGFSFSLEPGHPNAIAPNKRPMHTIIPGMLTRDGEAVMPFGVMGGHYQPFGQSWFLSNLLEYGMDIQEALDCPRILPRLGKLQVEHGVSAAARHALAGLGHVLTEPEEPLGGGQAIWIDRDRGILVGGSDPRKDGCALGY